MEGFKMKTFKELSEEYKELLIEGAKLKKKKIFKPDERGNLKKVLKVYCADSDGKVAKGFKIDGKKCSKMSPAEEKEKMKTMKKVQKTKKKNSSKLAKRAELIRKKKEGKGLIKKKVDLDEK